MASQIAIKAYIGEKYERSKLWRVVFFTIVGVLILASIVMAGLRGIVEVLVIGLIVSGYVFFTIFGEKPITLKLTEEGIWYQDKLMPWSELAGYVIEMDLQNEKIKNLVFVFPDGSYRIFGVDDADPQQLAAFLAALEQILPRLGGYNQTAFDKLVRMLKI